MPKRATKTGAPVLSTAPERTIKTQNRKLKLPPLRTPSLPAKNKSAGNSPWRSSQQPAGALHGGAFWQVSARHAGGACARSPSRQEQERLGVHSARWRLEHTCQNQPAQYPRAGGPCFSHHAKGNRAARFLAPAHLCLLRRQKGHHMQFVSIPPHSVIAHYAEVAPGCFAVVTVRGAVLGESFFAIREQFSFHCSINGAGCWVVLLPTPATQPALF